MIRLSGLLADRPNPGAATNARYYATDEEIVYASVGDSWQPDWPLDQSDVAGTLSDTISNRPTAGAYLGWIFVDSGNGDQYEGFPTAWAAINLGSGSDNAADGAGEFGVLSDILHIQNEPTGGTDGQDFQGFNVTTNSGSIDIQHDGGDSSQNHFQIGASASSIPFMILNLPITNPHVANALWNDSGTLKISAGP